MFEEASKLKLRFQTSVGVLSVEDLWDLPLVSQGISLDNLAKLLNKAVKESEEKSFVVKKSTMNITLGLKFDIVKHIIKVKLEEAEASEKKEINKAKKEKILELLAKKKDDALEEKSEDELKELLEELEG